MKQQLNIASSSAYRILGVKMADPSYTLDNIRVSAKNEGATATLDLAAPFADIHVKGTVRLCTL